MKQEQKLGEICDIFSGSRPKGGAISSGVLSIGGEHITSDGYFDLSNPKYIPKEYFKNLTRGILKRGDVLLVKDGATTGKVGFFGNEAPFAEGAVNEHVFVLRPKDSKTIKPEFICYFLKSKTGNNAILKRKVGSAQGGINLSIGDIGIILPAISKQQEIVSILEEIDDLRQKQRKAIELTRQMIPALFNEMRENKDCYQCKLENICSFEYGLTATAHEKGNARFVRITDISENGLLLSEGPKFIDLDQNNSKFLLQNDDVLVARTGATFGKTLLFKGDFLAVFASYLIRIQFDKSAISPIYYWIFSQTEEYWQQARLLVTGTGQPQFNANVLKNIQIPIPSMEVQKRNAEKIKEIFLLLENQEQSLKKLDALFESTLNRFFS